MDETLDDKINKIFNEKFKKQLSDTEKRLAKIVNNKKDFKDLYFSKKTGRKLGGTALLNTLEGAERKLNKLRLDSVKTTTKTVREINTAEEKLNKEILKDIKIEQNNRKKQALTHNSLIKKSIKKNYEQTLWVSNTFKNKPSNRNTPIGKRLPIQNNKGVPFSDIGTMSNFSNPSFISNFNKSASNGSKPFPFPNMEMYHQIAINRLNPNILAHIPRTNLVGSKNGIGIVNTGQSYNIPTQQQSGHNNVLIQSLKTRDTKKTNNIKSLVSWLLDNNVKQDTINNLMYDKNGRLSPVVDMEKVLNQEKLNVIALQNIGKPVTQSTQSYEDMSFAEKILYNKAKNRKIRLNKYGQDVAIKDPSTFNDITSGKTDDDILSTLEDMYNTEKHQLKMAKDAEKSRKDAEKAQRKADIDERKNRIQQEKNLREQQKLLKQQQRALEEERKERRKFFKDLISTPTPFSLPGIGKKTGYGALGLLGAGAGSLLGGVGGLIPSLLTGAVGGTTSLLGGAASLLGAGLGIKGLSKAGGLLSKGGANTLQDAKSLSGFGKTGAKYGAKAGAGAFKIAGKGGMGAFKIAGKGGMGAGRFAGKVFGKIPGIGMLTKAIPFVNTLVGVGALGLGIYDAWNSTDNTKDFLKEATWNTGGNLVSIATAGLIDADDAKNFGKNLAGKIEDSEIYKNAKYTLQENLKKTRLGTLYSEYFGTEDGEDIYEKILKKSKEGYEKKYPSYEDNWWNSTWAGNFVKISSDSFKKNKPKESFADYFWSNRGTIGSDYNLSAKAPNWMKNNRSKLTDDNKNISLGGNLFNTSSTATTANNTNVTNNNSNINVYNEPAQNKMTPMMAFGGF